MRIKKLFMLFVSAIFAAGAMSACGGGGSGAGNGNGIVAPPTRQPLPTPTPVGLETPAGNSIYLGAYAYMTHSAQDIVTLETQIGRKVALEMHYYNWTDTFPGNLDAADTALGRMPVDSWNCGPSNAQIVSGAADLLITTRALAIKSFGHPVFLRYLWEMNTPSSALNRAQCYDPSTDNPDTTFSATLFVQAWQHIRQVFAQANASNVIWVWSPAAAGSDPTPYYPGDSQVDWIGIDAYDTSGAGFASTFSSIYGKLAQYNKPILITETGETAANQAAFFQSAVPALQSQFPLIKGFIYYDANSATLDWRIKTAGAAAFNAFANDPYMSAMGSI